MIEWFAANWINILIIALIAAAVLFAVRSIIKDKKAGRCSCGCKCSGCAMADKCHSRKS